MLFSFYPFVTSLTALFLTLLVEVPVPVEAVVVADLTSPTLYFL